MRTSSDLFPLLAALKELHRELSALRGEINELKDEVKVMERGGGGIQFVIRPEGEEDESESDRDSESECDSVQSAPPTVSYDREGS